MVKRPIVLPDYKYDEVIVERLAERIFNSFPTNHLWKDAKESNRKVYRERAKGALQFLYEEDLLINETEARNG